MKPGFFFSDLLIDSFSRSLFERYSIGTSEIVGRKRGAMTRTYSTYSFRMSYSTYVLFNCTSSSSLHDAAADLKAFQNLPEDKRSKRSPPKK